MTSPVDAYARALRKIPAVLVAVLDGDSIDITPMGSIAGEPDSADLCWEIGSITKVFTGILLAEMSRCGEVGLDDPIGRYLPDDVAARLPDPADQPTLANLSTHTAGLPRLPLSIYRLAKGSDDPYSVLTEDDVLSYLGPKVRRPGGPKSRYSNYGAGLLGHLLARAGGRPYADLLRERVLDPFGLHATGIGTGTPIQGFRKGKPTPPWTFGALESAGGLRSTMADMVTFARIVMKPPDSAAGAALALSRETFHDGRFSAVGLGWMLRALDRTRRPVRIPWHNGGTYGGASFLAVDPARGVAVIALGNSGPGLTTPLDGPSWRVLDDLGV